ncbi:GNAT family N-acetyltransferase [Actinomycetes bacterium M1A6_2h]
MVDRSWSNAGHVVQFHVGADLDDSFLLASCDDLATRRSRHVAGRRRYAAGAVRLRKSRKFVLVTVHRGERLVAVAPLLVRRYGPLRVARLAGDDLGMVGEIVADDDEAVDALWSALAKRNIGLHLSEVDERIAAVSHPIGHPAWATTTNPGREVLVIDVPEVGPGAIGLRSRGSRRRLRVGRRHYREAGTPLTIDFLTAAAELDQHWQDMTRLSAAGIADHDRTDYLAPPLGNLVRSVLRLEADEGRLVVARLAVGRLGVAQLVMVRSGDVLEGWLTHYDPEFADAQPGHQMMERLVDHARDIGATRIDLGVGATAFKQAWATDSYLAITITTLPAGIRGARLLLPVIRRVESLSVRAVLGRGIAALTALPRHLSHR